MPTSQRDISIIIWTQLHIPIIQGQATAVYLLLNACNGTNSILSSSFSSKATWKNNIYSHTGGKWLQLLAEDLYFDLFLIKKALHKVCFTRWTLSLSPALSKFTDSATPPPSSCEFPPVHNIFMKVAITAVSVVRLLVWPKSSRGLR